MNWDKRFLLITFLVIVGLIAFAFKDTSFGQSAFRPDDIRADTSGTGTAVVNMQGRVVIQEGTNVTLTVDATGDTMKIASTASVTTWNWADSSSHGPDSVLYSDTAAYAPGDNLGNHSATQNLTLGPYLLKGSHGLSRKVQFDCDSNGTVDVFIGWYAAADGGGPYGGEGAIQWPNQLYPYEINGWVGDGTTMVSRMGIGTDTLIIYSPNPDSGGGAMIMLQDTSGSVQYGNFVGWRAPNVIKGSYLGLMPDSNPPGSGYLMLFAANGTVTWVDTTNWLNTSITAGQDVYVVNSGGSSPTVGLSDTIDITIGFIDTVANCHLILADSIIPNEYISLPVNSVTTGTITDQQIVKSDLDTTASNFVFDDAFHITSAVADSEYASLRTARIAAHDSVWGNTPAYVQYHDTLSFGATIWNPDGINDTILLFHCDSITYPGGITIDKIAITTQPAGAYTVTLHEYSIGLVWQATTDSVVQASGVHTEDKTPMNGTLDVGDFLKAYLPATDITQLHINVVYHRP